MRQTSIVLRKAIKYLPSIFLINSLSVCLLTLCGKVLGALSAPTAEIYLQISTNKCAIAV